MEDFQKNVLTYISENWLSHLDKTIILKSIIENKLDYFGEQDDMLGADLYLIQILCSFNERNVVKKILQFGIGNKLFTDNISNSDADTVKYVGKIGASSYTNLCLKIACKLDLDVMKYLAIEAGAGFCTNCFNIKHPNI